MQRDKLDKRTGDAVMEICGQISELNHSTARKNGFTRLVGGLLCYIPTPRVFRRHPNASVAGIWPISSLKGKVLVPGGRRSGQIFDIFELLRGAGDIYNSISMPNYYRTCLP